MARSDLEARYREWCIERERLAKLEDEEAIVRADDWHWSDDEAVELLREIAEHLGWS